MKSQAHLLDKMGLFLFHVKIDISTFCFNFSGDLQFNFYHRWFDVMFLVAALVTLAMLRLVHKRDIEAADSVKQPAYID